MNEPTEAGFLNYRCEVLDLTPTCTIPTSHGEDIIRAGWLDNLEPWRVAARIF